MKGIKNVWNGTKCLNPKNGNQLMSNCRQLSLCDTVDRAQGSSLTKGCVFRVPLRDCRMPPTHCVLILRQGTAPHQLYLSLPGGQNGRLLEWNIYGYTNITMVILPIDTHLENDRDVSAYTLVIVHAQLVWYLTGTPPLTHKGCVLQRVSLGALSNVTVVLGMRQNIGKGSGS